MPESKTSFKVSYIPGDDSGPRVIDAALSVMEKAVSRFPGLSFEYVKVEAGSAAYDKKKETVKTPRGEFGGVSEASMDLVRGTDALLYSAINGDRLAKFGLINPYPFIKKSIKCFADVRHGKSYPNTGAMNDNIDVVLVRETKEGFLGGHEFKMNDDTACQFVTMSRDAAESLARHAFRIAKYRTQKKVTCVHKSDMLPVFYGMFRDGCRKVSKEFPEIEYNEIATDYLAYALIKEPLNISVVATENATGEIISGEIPAIIGQLGMFPGAVYGDNFALFKPSHGTAPDIAGLDIINPCATILSGKMLLEFLGDQYNNNDCIEASRSIERAVWDQLSEGKVMTKDLGGNASTTEFTNALISRI